MKIKRILDGSSIIPEEEEKKNERKTAKPDPAKDKQGLSAVFRISSSTIFDELFKEACNFWVNRCKKTSLAKDNVSRVLRT